jgi:hypothetical protein
MPPRRREEIGVHVLLRRALQVGMTLMLSDGLDIICLVREGPSLGSLLRLFLVVHA